MKLTLLTTNLAGGGAEKALAKIGSGLAARGHQVDFVVCEDGGDYPPPPGCRFISLGTRASHGWLGKRHLAWRLNRLLATTGSGLLISTLPFADEVATLAHVPRHVCRIANTLSAELERLSPGKAARRKERYGTLYARRPLVAVSRGVATDLTANFGIDMNHIRVIGNAFDFAAIHALAAKPFPERPAEPYLLHVGRYAPQKRHDLLLAAFAALTTPQRLVLLTPPDPALEALIARHNLEPRVTIANFQANPYPWMAGAELLVLCSDHEGLPNVLIEALACGTRVVSTDCPSGPREILLGELAMGLVHCGDAKALASAIRTALLMPRPGAAAVAQALAPYQAAAVFDNWEALIQEIA